MRCLHSASTVIWLLNGFDKTPILNANITCNGKHWPYVRKPDGHYVFLDMHDGIYNFVVDCWGFDKKSYEVEIKNGKGVEIKDQLYYNKHFKDIYKLKKIVISLKKDGQSLANKDVKVIINDKIAFLKVIESDYDNEYKIKINGGYNKLYLMQEYLDNEDRLLFFYGYDSDTKKYLVKQDDDKKTSTDFYLRPAWNLKTDDAGEIIIPVQTLFMPGKKVSFLILVDEQSFSVEADVDDERSVSVDIE